MRAHSSVLSRPVAAFLMTTLLAAGCGSSDRAAAPSPAPTPTPTPPGSNDGAAVAPGDAAPPPSRLDGRSLDAKAWLKGPGCLAVRDLATGRTLTSDDAACRTPHRPHSTFKIANALIGLDAGVLAGPDAPMPWDRKAYPPKPDWFDGWNQDHTLRSAIKASSVPHFRTLAVTLGAERLRDGMARLRYGNQDQSGGLDSFWLTGDLRISALEQLDLVGGLAAGTLPFSAAAQAATRDILLQDERDGARLYYKTGTGGSKTGMGGAGEPYLGWLVGWVEVDGGVYPFAFWLEAPSFDELRPERLRVARGVLAELGLIAAPAPTPTP